tara:strand:+ start:1227 stop:1802 length:576 start_codon:yes stop_codon:yes gene_type:complete
MFFKKIKDVIFIILLGSLCTLALLGIRGYTLPIITQYEEFKFKSTILDAAGIEYSEDNAEQVFEDSIRIVQAGNLAYYLSPEGSYIFEFKGRGLWGPIRGVITLEEDLKTIEAMRIISQEETPGLGARITEDSYLTGFKGKVMNQRLTLALRRKAIHNNEIDSISGATLTSTALISMINEYVEIFRKKIIN